MPIEYKDIYSPPVPDPEEIPASMKAVKRWVCWGADKVPVNGNRKNSSGFYTGADITKTETWISFEEAMSLIGKAAYVSGEYLHIVGIGFVVGDGWFCLDADGGKGHGREPVPQTVIDDLCRRLKTYCETSLSGCGYHSFGQCDFVAEKGKESYSECRTSYETEFFTRRKFIVLTGNRVPGSGADAIECSEAARQIYDEYVLSGCNRREEAERGKREERSRSISVDSSDANEFFMLNYREILKYADVDHFKRKDPGPGEYSWIGAVKALGRSGIPREDIYEWCRRGSTFAGEKDIDRVLDERKSSSKPASVGSIIKDAIDNGWKPDPDKLTGEYKATHEEAEIKKIRAKETYIQRLCMKYKIEYREGLSATWNHDGSLYSLYDSKTGEVLFQIPEDDSQESDQLEDDDLEDNDSEAEQQPSLTDLSLCETDSVKFESGFSIDSGFVEGRVKSLDPAANYPFNTTDDIAAAQLFKAVFGDFIRYNATSKSWFVYDGIRWKQDPGDMTVENYAKLLARALWVYSADIPSKEFQHYVLQMQQRRRRRTMIDDARDLVPILQTDFDKDPNLFNCQNCVLNLKTHLAIPHDPRLLLSKVSNVRYDPEATSRIFLDFINQIMQGDSAKIQYLQTLIGYAMTGTNEREEAYMLYGSTTRNGKGTLTNTINHLFGDYGANIQPESLAMQKNKDGRTASGDIARLNGIRFLQMSEPPKRMKIDVALLKTLLGRDVVTARHLYEREFEFTPCFKLFINTNFLPVVLDDTLFSSGRVKVITFDRHFEESEQDKTLKDKLQDPEELSGILNWMLEGLKRYHADGKKIIPPESVRYATDDYRVKSDKIQNFIDETYVKDPEHPEFTIKGATLYENFVDWCHSNGYAAENKSNFFDELRAKGLLQKTGTIHGKTYHNVLKGYVWQ